MSASGIRRWTFGAIAALLLVAGCTSAETGGSPTLAEPPSPPSTSTTISTTPSPSGSEGVEPLRSVRIRPPRRGTLLVHGSYPRVSSPCVRPERASLTARYPGALTVRRTSDGTLSLNVTLTFDAYLKGIAEAPSSWPRAALEAQAIAARSYALATTGWDGAEGEPLATPICATTSCQVYRGIPVPFEPAVRRWYAAVRRTDGQVLLFDGRPADTVYFSTSNGHTYGNEDVFGSAPLPYLRPVVERDDGASPVSRWSVRLPFADVASFLHRAGEWPGERPISSVRLDGGAVVVSGDGRSRTMDHSTFRDGVNAWAHCLRPGRYPPPPLPTTIPSRWLSMSSDPNAVLVTGRGWGHGVGMVQWGAYGKALRGLSSSDILAYYYGGLRPRPFPEPGTIDVEVASGLTALRIAPSGEGATIDGDVVEARRLTITGGDELTVTQVP